MASKYLTALQKIKNLEEKRDQLLKQREQELVKIITQTKSLDIDDNLLYGFLTFIRNPANKDHPILQEFITITKGSKAPSKPKIKHVETT